MNAPEAPEDEVESAKAEATEDPAVPATVDVEPTQVQEVVRPSADHDEARAAENDLHDATTPNDTTSTPDPTHDTDVPPAKLDDRIHVVRTTALPPPSAGACAFEPPQNPVPEVDNANCPDGIFHGDVTLTTADDLNQLRGCTRVTGAVTVKFTDSTPNLKGLEALRVIEGRLNVTYMPLPPCYPRYCANWENQQLKSLRGLDNLRCIGGDLNVSPIGGLRSLPRLDYSSLHDLVEVGGYVYLYAWSEETTPQQPTSFTSLRRVWGNFSTQSAFDLPQLETVYGSFKRSGGGPLPGDLYVGCSDGTAYCRRDGVLGCSVQVSSQSELEQLSECELSISGISISGVTSLSPLAKLREVRGGLSLHAQPDDPPALRSLAGLSGLRTLSSLVIDGLPLTDLHELSGLENCAWISLEHMHQLVDLSGLSGLAEIAGLSSQEPIKIVLSDLPALSTLEHLAGVEISGIQIQGLPLITDLHGLEGAGEDIDAIALLGNDALQNVDALANVRSAVRLDIENNPALVSLQGLERIEQVTGGASVTNAISNNASLPQCAAAALGATLSIVAIDNDPTGICTP